MEHNLIPPFILCQVTGILLNDVLKIHYQNPFKEEHCILHHETGLSIKLTLDCVLSVFDIRAPTVEDLLNGVCIRITLEGVIWDPYDPLYSLMEVAMIDIGGDILAPKYVEKY